MGNLWHCCVRMPETLKLPFGVVIEVRPKKGVLDAGSFEGFDSHRLLWGFYWINGGKYIVDFCEKS